MLKVLLVIVTVAVGSFFVKESIGCSDVNKYATSVITDQNSIFVADKKFWESQENSGGCNDSQVYCDYFFNEFKSYIVGKEPLFFENMTVFKTDKYAIFLIENKK